MSYCLLLPYLFHLRRYDDWSAPLSLEFSPRLIDGSVLVFVMLAGNIFSTGFSSIIRAEGKMAYSLLIWFIPTAINIIFDIVFIFVMDMGVQGAALSTVLCQFTSFSMSIFFFKKLSCQCFRTLSLN